MAHLSRREYTASETRSPDACTNGRVKVGGPCCHPLHQTMCEALHRKRRLLREIWLDAIVSDEVRGSASMLPWWWNGRGRLGGVRASLREEKDSQLRISQCYKVVNIEVTYDK